MCDADNILVAITISGGENYIIAPTDAAAQDPLWVIGREGEETLAEYAAAQGKPILTVGASMSGEALGLAGQSQRTENLSDGEMVILITADKQLSRPEIETTCTVYARVIDSETVERLELPLTLHEGATRELGAFTPEVPDGFPGMSVGDAIVTETPLGISIRYPVTVTDQTAFDTILKTDFVEITDLNGGPRQDENGELWAVYTMGRGKVGDRLTAVCYDWDKQPIGEIVFHKK